MALDGKVIIGTKVDESGLKQGMDSVRSSLDGFKNTLAKLGIGAAVSGAFFSVKKEFSAFENTLNKASTLFGQTGVDLDLLSDKVLGLSRDTAIAASELNEGLYQALSAGVPVSEDMGEAMDFLASSAKLATAGFTEMPTAIEATAKTLNAYGMAATEAEHIQDILIATQNLGITTVDELGGTLANVTPIASAFGVSFEQIGASLALLTAKGIPTAVATTQLRQVIAELGKDGTQAATALERVARNAGLPATSFKELMDAGFSLGEVLNLLSEDAEANGKSVLDMFSSIEAGQAALAISSDLEKFDSNLQAMANSAGSVEAAYTTMTDSIDFQSRQMKAKLSTLAISLGDVFKEPFKTLLSSLNIALDSVIKYIPVIEIGFETVGQLAHVIGVQISRTFEQMSKDIKAFLDFTGLDTVVDVVLQPVGELWDNLKSFVETGDLGFLIAGAGNLLAIGTELYLVKQTAQLLLGSISQGLGLAKTSKGALGLGVLTLSVALAEAVGEEGGFESFGRNLAVSLAAGIGIGAFTGSPQAGVLAFTLLMNLKVGDKIDNIAREAFGDPEAIAEGYAEDLATKLRNNKDLVEAANGFGGLTWNELKKQAKEGGSGIGEFLAVGFGLGVEDLDHIARYQAENILATMREVLQIHSPSKATEEMGEYLVEGFENGMMGFGETTAGIIRNGMERIQTTLDAEPVTPKIDTEPIAAAVKEIDNLGIAFDKGEAATEKFVKTSEELAKTRKEYDGMLAVNEALGEEYYSQESLLSNLKSAYAALVAEGAKPFSFEMMGLLNQINEIEEKIEQGEALEKMQAGIESLGGVFENVGAAIAEGEDAWSVFAKAGLTALSKLIEGLGELLAAKAAELYASYNIPLGALATAGSVAAFAAAGLVKGWAGTFATGGIVRGPYTGGDNLTASVKAGEVILNHAQAVNVARLLEALKASTESGGGMVIAFNGPVYGDEERIATTVYDKIRTLQQEGRLRKW